MNVIAVDWSGGNQFPYDQAVANTVIAGTALHKLLEKMIQRGAKGTQMHLIGHSLGAHIAGHTGKLLGNLARISALGKFIIKHVHFVIMFVSRSCWSGFLY